MRRGAATRAVLVLTLLAPGAFAERFEIRSGEEENLVRFRSSAPLESFDGKTRAVSGWIRADLPALSESVVVFVEADLATLDTGIDLRNAHMRENHLHTDDFPKAVFRGGRIVDPIEGSWDSEGRARFSLAGMFSLHGVTRPLAVPVEIRRGKNGSLLIETAFEIRLSDFEIPRPQFLLLRLNEVQRVHVRIVAHPLAAEQEEAP
ncbi:MAG: YceI family protein [Candidatus Eisenbacteria bacterium]|nr:YceI family protein [Candidatus Eisenbacteria bacterium]